MSLTQAVQTAYAALLEEASKIPLLLIHPKSRYRQLLVARLLQDTQVKSLYFALGPADTSLQAFVENLAAEFQKKMPHFGKTLKRLSPEIYLDLENQIEPLVEVFVQALTEVSDQPYFLLLDNYDYSETAEAIQRFIEDLLDRLPAQTHLILNSRRLPRLPWLALIAKGQAALLLNEQPLERDFSGRQHDEPYDLEVSAFGAMSVKYQGKEISSWEGHLPRQLFFFVLDKTEPSRAEICQAFWPNLALDSAVNVFHVTKRRLNKALGFDVLLHQDDHYSIDTRLNVYYDVQDFVENLIKARNAKNSKAFEAWQQAAKLYRGAFMQGQRGTWIEKRRLAFRAGYLEALTAMAESWMSKNQQENALKIYLQFVDEDFQCEDIQRQVLQLYSDLGRRNEAIDHYEALQKTFKKAGLKLSDATVKLAREI